MVRDPLHAFWINIQYAHEFMPPLAVPNPARLKPEEVEKWFRLTPHTAEGFQEEAFSFLPPNELATLTDNAHMQPTHKVKGPNPC